jgi:hypothetical protein
MKTDSSKYDKLLYALRKSKPVLRSTDDIEREVLKRISKKHSPSFIINDAIEFLFSWIYISWVRRTLITASVLLVGIFVLQQGMILREINFLNRQAKITDSEDTFDPPGILEKRLLMYKQSHRIFPPKNITISEKQMNQLLDSINDLQKKYRNIMNIIEKDPELKKYIERNLAEKNQTKTKL